MINFVTALALCEQGLEKWKAKPHNAKWWRRIDGTPIPNDLLVNIAEEIANAEQDTQAEALHGRRGA
jgi:hypothetical protein